MVSFDRGNTLAERFRAHAGDAQHLYGHVMRGMADDWEAGGPVREICRGHRDPEGAVLQLRLLAGVFRLVLTGRADELVEFYPCLDGRRDPAEAWPVMRTVMAREGEALRAALLVPPQTNEIGRSAALLAGLFDLVRASRCSRIRLLELGASGGLNLLIDRFHFAGTGWHRGPLDSPVHLLQPIEGEVAPADFRVESARGCDLHPVDVTTAAGRLALTSFVWPFDVHRHQRLAAALQIAVDHPPTVEAGSASVWLADQLARPSDDGVLTVVWHSITQMYWPEAERDAVEVVLAAHGARQRLAAVAMEYDRADHGRDRPSLTTRLWRPGEPLRQHWLGTVHDHGIPVRLA